MGTEQQTYLLIDGENLDATLGGSILQRRPGPEERPRWERLLRYLEKQWEQPVAGLFFLAVNGELPAAFVQALTAIGFRAIPLSGAAHEPVVDIAIQRTLDALAERPGDGVVASHDGDFLPWIERLLDGRRVATIGFREFRNRGFAELESRGLGFFDLEYDVRAFNQRLPRVRVIPIGEFDPLDFL
jgi:uncharacterized protein